VASDSPPSLIPFGRALRALRSEAGFTQEQLAQAASLHMSYVSGIEQGQRNPSYLTLLALAHGLGVTAAELVERAERLAARGVGS
jgi:transcriptional regulator with XRE-family HTH domain